jgi:putative flippase GtrA
VASRRVPAQIRSIGERIARFGIIGVGVNAVFYAVYLLATRLPIAPEIVTSVSYVLAVVCLYLLNRAWSFSDRTPPPGAPLRFAIAYGLAYLFYIGVFAVLYRVLGWPHEIVQLATIFCTAAVTFMLLNSWAFRDLRGAE